MNEFGEALREARIGAGLRQADVAAVLGVSVAYLSDVERGRRAPLAQERVCLAARLLGCPSLRLVALRARLEAGWVDVSHLTDTEREHLVRYISGMLERRVAA